MKTSWQSWASVVSSTLLVTLAPVVRSSAPTSEPLSKSTTSQVIHDNFFIPALASMGSLLLIALFCIYMIIRGAWKSQADHLPAVKWKALTPGGCLILMHIYVGKGLKTQKVGHAQNCRPGSPMRLNSTLDLPSSLGRRPSKVQRKHAMLPLVASVPSEPPLAPSLGGAQPSGGRPSYPTYQSPSIILASRQQVDQLPVVSGPQNASVGFYPAQWNPPPAVISVRPPTAHQSMHTVCGDVGFPIRKPYSAMGNYGSSAHWQLQMSSQPQNDEFGAHQPNWTSQPLT